MAKKRNAGLESAVTGAGPAAAREHRRRNKANPIPAVPSAEVKASGEYRIGAAAGSEAFGSLQPGAAAQDRAAEYREIARLAYSYWEARGRQGGSAEEDWLRAEGELRAGRARVVGA